MKTDRGRVRACLRHSLLRHKVWPLNVILSGPYNDFNITKRGPWKPKLDMNFTYGATEKLATVFSILIPNPAIKQVARLF